jgi:hypothetical protein
VRRAERFYADLTARAQRLAAREASEFKEAPPMIENCAKDEEFEEAKVRPFRALSHEQEKALQRWRTRGRTDKEGLVITLFSLGILILSLLLALRTL